MKFLTSVLLFSLVSALPQGYGTSAAELDEGPCREAYLIVARGSTEPGTIGMTVGPMLCGSLKEKYGNKFGCQGISGYSAALEDNFKPKGTSDASIEAGVNVFKTAVTKCPKAALTFVGYSQGAALMHNVVAALPQEIKDKTVGGILFGDTKNEQSNATIEGYPKDRLSSFCEEEDGVCWGELRLSAGHFAYIINGDVKKAADFLIGKLDKALASKA